MQVKNLLIFFALAVIIILSVLLWFNQSPAIIDNTVEQRLQDSLQRTMAVTEILKDHMYKKRVEDDSIKAGKDREILELKRKLSRIRPEVIRIIEKDTTLTEAWTLTDLIIETDSIEIDRLNTQLTSERSITDELMKTIDVKDRLHTEE